MSELLWDSVKLSKIKTGRHNAGGEGDTPPSAFWCMPILVQGWCVLAPLLFSLLPSSLLPTSALSCGQETTCGGKAAVAAWAAWCQEGKAGNAVRITLHFLQTHVITCAVCQSDISSTRVSVFVRLLSVSHLATHIFQCVHFYNIQSIKFVLCVCMMSR